METKYFMYSIYNQEAELVTNVFGSSTESATRMYLLTLGEEIGKDRLIFVRKEGDLEFKIMRIENKSAFWYVENQHSKAKFNVVTGEMAIL